jgi:glycosyltransferase involved in cell wall biosynthesis
MPMTLRGFLLPFARHFRAKGWIVDGAANGASKAEDVAGEFDRVFDFDVARSPLGRGNFTVAPRQLQAALAGRRYDIVHAHTPVAAFVARAALNRFRGAGGVRMIYTAHGFHFHPRGSALGNFVFSCAEKWAGRWTDDLVVINRTDEAAARRLRIVPDERIHYMPGIGVDLEAYGARRVAAGEVAAFRASLGLAAGDVLFTMPAEFNPGKRHVDAIEAFAAMGSRRTHLALAGAGPLEAKTKELASRLGVAGRVHFLGWRRDIPVVLKASAAMVLPSVREGLPRSIQEAMSLGVAVIGSDIRGIRDLLETGAGILHPPCDVEGLRRAMERIAGDADAARAMGEEGRRRVEEFSLARVIACHERLYGPSLGTAHGALPEPAEAAR